MKKRILLYCLSLAFVLLGAGCAPRTLSFAIEGASKLAITCGTTGETIEVQDEESIQHITNNINALRFSDQGKVDGSGWSYALNWLDQQGNSLETIALMGDGYTITYDGRYYKGMDTDHAIDLAFLDGLFSNTQAEALDWGITLRAQDVQPTGLTLVIDQTGGSPTGELQYGSDYRLDILQAGQWEALPYVLEGDVAWTSEAYVVPMEGTVEEEIAWERLYGSLAPGTYRLSKSFMDFRGAGDYDTQTYWAVFKIM